MRKFFRSAFVALSLIAAAATVTMMTPTMSLAADATFQQCQVVKADGVRETGLKQVGVGSKDCLLASNGDIPKHIAVNLKLAKRWAKATFPNQRIGFITHGGGSTGNGPDGIPNTGDEPEGPENF